MNLVTKIRLYVIWTQLKNYLLPALLISSLFFIINLGAYLSGFVGNYSPAIMKALQDPMVATVIGAVVGGAIALYGSIYVQRNQVKAEAAIHRRDVIFIPLYDELLGLRRSLQEHPCPDFILTSDKERNPNFPKFAVWRSFKESSKSLQVPKLLTNSLDQFLEIIDRYRDTRIAAINDQEVDKVIRKIIVANSERNSKRVDLVYHYLPCNNNLSKIINHLETDTSIPKTEGRQPITKLIRTKTDEEIKVIAQTIYQECSVIESVNINQAARQDLDHKLNELIQSLDIVIRYINEKFEQNERWF